MRLDILDTGQLYDRVLSEPENNDLFDEKDVGGEKVQRLRYLKPKSGLFDKYPETHFVISLDTTRIVGAGTIQTNPYNTEQIWVCHVSVEDVHEGKGFARKILEAIYVYAVEHGQKVVAGSFTKRGQCLKHIHTELDARYPQAASGEPHKDF